MKTVAAAEVRKQWDKVLQEHAGSEITVTNNGEVVAYLRVVSRRKAQKVEMPDFRARIEARFGKRTLSAADMLWLDEASKSRH